jgi:hypothetical protein
MAFAVKYRLPFVSNNGVEYNLDISEDDFVGSITELTGWGVSGVNIEQPAPTNFWQPLRGSILVANVVSNDDFDFLEFSNALYGTFKAELKNLDTGITEWTGFNSSDIYSEPYVVNPYPAKLVFSDGIGEMKPKKFLDGADNFITGTMSLIDVIRTCMARVNPLPIYEAVNLYAQGQDNELDDSLFDQTNIVTESYLQLVDGSLEPFSCYQVLEAVLSSLPDVQIVQIDSAWWIVRVRELSSTVNWRKFTTTIGSGVDSFGTKNFEEIVSRKSVGASSDIYPVEADQNLTILEKIRRVTYIHETVNSQFGVQSGNSIIRNGQFLKSFGLTEDGMPLFWERENLSDAELEVRAVDDDFSFVFREIGGITPDLTKYVYSKTTTRFMVEEMRLSIRITSDAETTYPENWEFTAQTPQQLWGYLPVKVIFTRLSDSTKYYISGDLSFEYSEVEQAFTAGITGLNLPLDYKQVTNVDFPATDFFDVEVFVYKPYLEEVQPVGREVNFLFKEIDVVNIGQDSVTVNPQDTFIHVQEVDSFHDKLEVNAFHSDSVIGSEVSDANFRLLSGLTTKIWRERGASTSYQIWEHFVRDALSLRSDSVKQLTGTFEGVVNGFSVLKTTVGAFVDYYVVQGYSRDVAMDRYNLDMTAIRSFTIPATITEEQGTTPNLEPDPDAEVSVPNPPFRFPRFPLATVAPIVNRPIIIGTATVINFPI